MVTAEVIVEEPDFFVMVLARETQVEFKRSKVLGVGVRRRIPERPVAPRPSGSVLGVAHPSRGVEVVGFNRVVGDSFGVAGLYPHRHRNITEPGVFDNFRAG